MMKYEDDGGFTTEEYGACQRMLTQLAIYKKKMEYRSIILTETGCNTYNPGIDLFQMQW